MRLIDADELKKEVSNNPLIDFTDDDLFKLIDNAPTVEAIPTELHEKILDLTAGELLECQSNLRTQGEWKLHGMIDISDLNFSINIIKSLCNSQAGCIDCPMNKNCNEFPPRWEEVQNNEIHDHN